MNNLIFIFFIFSFSTSLYSKDCDPENVERFLQVCNNSSDDEKGKVQQLPLWQGTDHSGYQMLDCKRGWIKNIIDETGESYACEITEESKKMFLELDKVLKACTDKNKSPCINKKKQKFKKNSDEKSIKKLNSVIPQ